jgi:hypothetical protein
MNPYHILLTYCLDTGVLVAYSIATCSLAFVALLRLLVHCASQQVSRNGPAYIPLLGLLFVPSPYPGDCPDPPEPTTRTATTGGSGEHPRDDLGNPGQITPQRGFSIRAPPCLE